MGHAGNVQAKSDIHQTTYQINEKFNKNILLRLLYYYSLAIAYNICMYVFDRKTAKVLSMWNYVLRIVTYGH